MPIASPSDVREFVDTDLSDEDITAVLSRVARDVERTYADDDDVSFVDDDHRVDFEAALAALRVATGRDRRVVRQSRGEVSVTWANGGTDQLRAAVTRFDPGDEFSKPAGAVRNTNRTVRTVGERTVGDDD